jgi:hypothetical protein
MCSTILRARESTVDLRVAQALFYQEALTRRASLPSAIQYENHPHRMICFPLSCTQEEHDFLAP